MISLKINGDDTRASFIDLNAIRSEINDAGLISQNKVLVHIIYRYLSEGVNFVLPVFVDAIIFLLKNKKI